MDTNPGDDVQRLNQKLTGGEGKDELRAGLSFKF